MGRKMPFEAETIVAYQLKSITNVNIFLDVLSFLIEKIVGHTCRHSSSSPALIAMLSSGAPQTTASADRFHAKPPNQHRVGPRIDRPLPGMPV
jgi:hypothetical protein